MASQSEYGISLMGMQELDRLTRRFRRTLRDAAVRLLTEAGDSAAIGPDTVREATPFACRELVSDLGSGCSDERGADGSRREAA